jgi:DNA-binding transcriptional LysR family regulator
MAAPRQAAYRIDGMADRLRTAMQIDRRWLPLNALRAFEAVGRNLSFTAAAAALSVSQSAVSRHVIALEGLLGAQLFERKPGAFALTDSGAALLPVVRKSFDRIEQALNHIVNDGGAKSRSLRVQLPPSFAQLLAVPILREFRSVQPEVILDIESPHQVGLAPRDADAAVIYAKPHASEHVANLLWMERLVPLCHPDVAARAQAGTGTAAFLAAAELLHSKLDGEPRHLLWQMLVRQAGLDLEVDRGLVFDTAALAGQYALSGEGVALLDPRLFAAEMAAGRLVSPFPAIMESGYGYYLMVHPEDLTDPAIAGFRQWMIERFGLQPAAEPNREDAP